MQDSNWFPLTKTPPDKKLMVIDKNNRVAYGQPTYYPFRTEPTPGGGKYSTKVIPCEPYWDGGWLIQVPPGSLSTDFFGVIGWKEIE